MGRLQPCEDRSPLRSSLRLPVCDALFGYDNVVASFIDFGWQNRGAQDGLSLPRVLRRFRTCSPLLKSVALGYPPGGNF